ncbi:MAG: hypothetical protein K2X11_08505 [Acetobacteraceae bacterium]|nr:hypothetical protein [Acetobacteraceae bacterium]
MAGLLAVALVGCAAGANPGAMVPPVSGETIVSTGSRLRQAVAVGTISGGRETNPLWTSQVSDPAFAEALRQSLATHALLSVNNQAFRLDARLLELNQPFIGLDMEVTARVAYRLTRVSDGAVVFETEIRSPFTATFGSSLYAVERLRLGNEGAIRENIRQFLAQLVGAEQRNPLAFGGPAA